MKYFDNLMEKNYHIQSYNAYRVTRNFAGVNICGLAIFCVLRELILATIGQIGFSCWELIFAIFRKYSVPSIDNIFVFVKYAQYKYILKYHGM